MEHTLHYTFSFLLFTSAAAFAATASIESNTSPSQTTPLSSYCSPNEICNAISGRIGWVSTSPLRNSFDILYSCLATFFACAWSILQLNLPGPHDTKGQQFRRKVKWMAITIIFPEILAAIALIEFGLARQSRKEIRKLSRGEHWTTTHGFFANMGGFVLESPELQDFPLNTESLEVLVTDGSLEIPDVEEKVINDRNKVDAFARAFAVLQGFWTITQCLARYEEGLPVTALEVNAVLFTVIGLWTYGFQWCKPKDVSVPIKLVYPKKLDDRKIDAISEIYDRWYDQQVGDTLDIQRIPFGPLFPSYLGGNLKLRWYVRTLFSLLTILSAGYNSAHLWVHSTLFNPEMWLAWRVFGLAGAVLSLLANILIWSDKWTVDKRVSFYWKVLLAFYMLARVGLLILGLVSFYSLPVDAYYDVNWTTFIPHF